MYQDSRIIDGCDGISVCECTSGVALLTEVNSVIVKNLHFSSLPLLVFPTMVGICFNYRTEELKQF